MHALLAVLRFPFDRRPTVVGPATRNATPLRRARHDVAASTAAPRPIVSAPVAVATPIASTGRLATTDAVTAVNPVTLAAAAAPAPLTAPHVENRRTPSEPVAGGHLRLSDPRGVRVVPFRPTTRWPLHRACARIYDPFRAFPDRGAQLAGWLESAPDRR